MIIGMTVVLETCSNGHLRTIDNVYVEPKTGAHKCRKCRDEAQARRRAKLGPNKPTWNTWKGMLTRCRNPRDRKFEYYGGRGIVVCERWLSFKNFLEDMGPRPQWATGGIDRIDNERGYEPDNCRWATAKQQANNRRPRRRRSEN